MKTTRNFIIILLFAFLAIAANSCGVARQAKQASNLASCEFRILGVGDVNVAGVKFDNVRTINDLTIGDAAMIMSGLASPAMPLSLRLDVEAKNPNASEAGMQRLEYMLYIDDTWMTSGILDQPVTIPAKSTQVIPVNMAIDLKQALSGNSATAILNFCMNLTGVGKVPSRFLIKLKPTIYIGSTPLTYPGFIPVKTEYTGK